MAPTLRWDWGEWLVGDLPFAYQKFLIPATEFCSSCWNSYIRIFLELYILVLVTAAAMRRSLVRTQGVRMSVSEIEAARPEQRFYITLGHRLAYAVVFSLPIAAAKGPPLRFLSF
ncbi:hypothetical protein CH365_08250 [Leptospira neocaledonica]|uniref:Uncharacterized protein n=1 Tax=Leptospira neocaledonica TaxID=2023192 RepID=A0A2M9ZZS6_9LEPT|nr:hypothetical protein CH365_08250 [Leptospira neocaledonica]